jgi:hypothetical protein
VSVTLLQLVNRVRRGIGWEDVSAVTDRVSVVFVDLIGAAQREVLETAEWDFAQRHDGVVKLVKKRSYTTGTTATAVASVVSGGTVDYTKYAGAFRTRLVVTDDASYGSTSFNVTTAATSGGFDGYTIDLPYPGATQIGSANVDLFVCEYQLPDTVSDVLSVRDEEGDLRLEFVDKSTRFDALFPNAHQLESSQPTTVYVGGMTTNTTLVGGTATTALGLWVWPIPTFDSVLRYSYRYRFPDLTTAASILDVPAHIADDIVDLAVARAYRLKIASNPDLAAQMEIATQARLKRKRAMTSAQPTQRRSMGSHDRQGAGRNQFGAEPRNPREFV